MTTKLLTTENPLILLPSLAVEFGVTEALLLQQIHYWLGKADTLHGGKRWTYQTVEQWHAQMPFVSTGAIRRALTKLKKLGIIVVAKLARWKTNRTNYYTLDYSKLATIVDFANQLTAQNHQVIDSQHVPETTNASAQTEQMDVIKLSKSNRSNCADVYTETKQRLPKEKNNRANLKKSKAPTPVPRGTNTPTIPDPNPDQLAGLTAPLRNLWRQLRQAKLDISHDDPLLAYWINHNLAKTISQHAIEHLVQHNAWHTPDQLGLGQFACRNSTWGIAA